MLGENLFITMIVGIAPGMCIILGGLLYCANRDNIELENENIKLKKELNLCNYTI